MSFKKISEKGFLNYAREVIQRGNMRVYEKSQLFRSLVQRATPYREPNQWIFVLGCYNSGTTLLKDLIASHPRVCELPKEGVRFTNVLRRPDDIGWFRMWTQCLDYLEKDLNLEKEDIEQIVKDWSPWWNGAGDVFLEKSITNLLRAERFEKYLKNAYFIGIVRNGYAVSEGIIRRAAPQGIAKQKIGDSYPIEMAAEEWMEANQRLLDLQKKLTNMLLIRYEDLITSPTDILSQVFEFLRLEPMNINQQGNELYVNNNRFKLFNGNQRSFRNLDGEKILKVQSVIAPLLAELNYEIEPPVISE